MSDTILSSLIDVSSVETCDRKRADLRCNAVEDHPQGYPRLASYINSDANFANYRRFGYLRNRALLQRQDELCVLQERLETLDDEDKEKEPLNLQSRERDEKYNSTRRRELIYEIEAKLNVYGSRRPSRTV